MSLKVGKRRERRREEERRIGFCRGEGFKLSAGFGGEERSVEKRKRSDHLGFS